MTFPFNSKQFEESLTGRRAPRKCPYRGINKVLLLQYVRLYKKILDKYGRIESTEALPFHFTPSPEKKESQTEKKLNHATFFPATVAVLNDEHFRNAPNTSIHQAMLAPTSFSSSPLHRSSINAKTIDGNRVGGAACVVSRAVEV